MHHNHEAQQTARSFNKIFATAVILTAFYIIFEIFYGLYANSSSLLADAIHNLGDLLGLLLAWLANWLLTFPPRQRYSYGYKRTTIIAALFNASILIATSILIGYDAIYKLFHLERVNEDVVIFVGVLGIMINGGCSLLFMRGAHADLNIKGAFLHLLADAIILAGVVFTAILIKFTHIYWLDPLIALLIVLIVLWGTWGLMRNSLRLMMDAVPHYIDTVGVRKYLLNLPGVVGIHDLHIWGLSTNEVALTVHVVMPESNFSDEDYQQINKTLREQFRINHATLQVEKGDLCINCESEEGVRSSKKDTM